MTASLATAPLNTVSTPPSYGPGAFWAALQQSALVGLQRLPIPAALCAEPPAGSSASAQALYAAWSASVDSSAQALLRTSAVATYCERAGWLPPTALADQAAEIARLTPAQPLPAPRPEETALAPVLASILLIKHQNLTAYALRRMAGHGLCLPPQVLPLALALGARNTALRPLVCAVAGDRGRWLAGLCADWRYAAGVGDSASAEDIWAHGNLAQRSDWLEQERARAPEAARERLQAALPSLPAKERLALVAILRTGLDANDEALLQTLLTSDRSKELRRLAAQLLASLPTSAQSQRLCAAVAALLTQDAQGRWQIQAPEQADPAWEGCGMALQAPPDFKQGQRAWWLQEIVTLTPLDFWTATLGMQPPALRAWARRSDWDKALRQGWLWAIEGQCHSDAAPAWASTLPQLGEPWRAQMVFEQLHQRLNTAQRNALWLADLQTASAQCQDQSQNQGQGQADPQPLLDALGRLAQHWPVGESLSPDIAEWLCTTLLTLWQQQKPLSRRWRSSEADGLIAQLPTLLDGPRFARFAAYWQETLATQRPEDDKLPWDLPPLSESLPALMQARGQLESHFKPHETP